MRAICDLRQKIKETGIEMGKRKMIMKMYNKGYTAAQIADVTEMDEKTDKRDYKKCWIVDSIKDWTESDYTNFV